MGERDVCHFGAFRLDAGDRRLSRGDEIIRLPPKALDVLIALVTDAGRLVTKDRLLTLVWPDAFVDEGILAVHISALRKALGDERRPPSYIETVARSGYRFIATVESVASHAIMDEVSRPVEVYELVGRGRAHLLSGSSFGLAEAVIAFQAAVEIDPEYAAAHAGLALARCTRASIRAVPTAEAYAAAKASAMLALALDPTSADAQVALGTVLFLSEWAWTAAERSLRRALEINPAHTEGLLQLGSLMEAFGQLEEGLQFKRRALQRDAPSALVFVQIALAYWHQRKYEDARAWAQRVLEIDPKHLLAADCLSAVFWALGDRDAFAAESVRRARAFGASDDMLLRVARAVADVTRAYDTRGPAAAAALIADQLAAREQGTRQKASVLQAVFCGAAGRFDEAFAHLDHAIASRDPALVHLAVAPQWDSLREDPRLAERLRILALP